MLTTVRALHFVKTVAAKHLHVLTSGSASWPGRFAEEHANLVFITGANFRNALFVNRSTGMRRRDTQACQLA
jgi:hypothetical protein